MRRTVSLATSDGRRFNPAVDALVWLVRGYDWQGGRHDRREGFSCVSTSIIW